MWSVNYLIRGGPVVVLLGLLMLAVVACGGGGTENEAGSKEPIRIGSVFPFSGAAATYGEAYRRATEMAVAEANDEGGINGRKLEFIFEDDASDPAQGVAAVRRLIQRENVSAIFGGTYTPPTLAEFKAATDAGVVFFSPGTSAPQLTEPPKELVFQTNMTQDDYAKPMAKLTASMQPQRVGVVKQPDSYGDLVFENFEKQFREQSSADIVEVQSMEADATSAASQVSALKDANVDVVVLGLTTTPTLALLKEAYESGLDVPFIASGGGADPAIQEVVSSEAPLEYYAVTPLACTLEAPCAEDFMKRFRERYPSAEPLVYDAQGYVSAKVFIEGLREAKDPTDPDSLVQALETMPPYKSELLSYPMDFTENNHRGIRNAFLFGYQDGKLYFFGNDVNDNQIESG